MRAVELGTGKFILSFGMATLSTNGKVQECLRMLHVGDRGFAPGEKLGEHISELELASMADDSKSVAILFRTPEDRKRLIDYLSQIPFEATVNTAPTA